MREINILIVVFCAEIRQGIPEHTVCCLCTETQTAAQTWENETFLTKIIACKTCV